MNEAMNLAMNHAYHLCLLSSYIIFGSGCTYALGKIAYELKRFNDREEKQRDL